MSSRPDAIGLEHAISAGHQLAAEAGFAVLEAGGNAIDAGVAAGLVLEVVQSDLVNMGGIAPIMLYVAESNRVLVIDGVGTWPSAITADFFARRGDSRVPEGILRSIVPGAPSAWITALGAFGTMSFADVASAAIRYAERGFAVDKWFAYIVAQHVPEYQRWQENARIYLPEGLPPNPGDRFIQRDLAATLTYMADQERGSSRHGRLAGIKAAHDAFYTGDIARSIVRFHESNDGLLRMDDLARYRARTEGSTVGRFKDLEIHCCGPWSQGPMLAQGLGILATLPLERFRHNSAAYLHVVIEALKLAFADRERWYGDPQFSQVPMDDLLSDEYLRSRAGLIRSESAWPTMPTAGDPTTSGSAEVAGDALAAGSASPHTGSVLRDTSYVAVVDRAGNAFSATPSDVSWDSPIIPGTGLCASPRGSQSSTDPRHPASVSPGKRPRVTPNPAIVLKSGRPHIVFGTPGGDMQPQAMIQYLLNSEIFGMGPQEAVEAARIGTYSFPLGFAAQVEFPGLVMAEPGIAASTRSALARMGHRVEAWPNLSWMAGGVCAIHIDNERRLLRASADPRRDSLALAV